MAAFLLDNEGPGNASATLLTNGADRRNDNYLHSTIAIGNLFRFRVELRLYFTANWRTFLIKSSNFFVQTRYDRTVSVILRSDSILRQTKKILYLQDSNLHVL